MSFRLVPKGSMRRTLAYSILAAVSSVGLPFAATSPTTTTSTSASMGSQPAAGSQSTIGSTNPCPNMGGLGGGSSTSSTTNAGA